MEIAVLAGRYLMSKRLQFRLAEVHRRMRKHGIEHKSGPDHKPLLERRADGLLDWDDKRKRKNGKK